MLVLFGQTPEQALAYGAEYFLSATFSFLIFTPPPSSWAYQPFPKARRAGCSSARCWRSSSPEGVLSLNAVPQERPLFPLLPIVVVCASLPDSAGPARPARS